jgi:hypothetical protein
MDAKDQFLRIFPSELQFAGVSEAWARKTTAELFTEVGSQDSRFFTWRKVNTLHSSSMLSVNRMAVNPVVLLRSLV